MTRHFAIASAVLLSLTLGATLAHAGQAKSKTMLLPGNGAVEQRLNNLWATMHQDEQAAPEATHAGSMSMLNWLFRDMNSDPTDLTATPTVIVPDTTITMVPPVVTEVPTPSVPPAALAPNRIFKLQIGKGHKLDIQQHGAGNSASIVQSK